MTILDHAREAVSSFGAWFADPEPTLGLALSRAALGAVLAADGVKMLREYELWYADGALRSRLLRHLPPWLDVFHWVERLGLSGRGVFVAMPVLAIAFGLGIWTKLTGTALLIVWIAVPVRNLFIVYGGDALARDILLLLLFSPCSASISVDRWWTSGDLGLESQAPPWGARLIAIELAVIYFYNAARKWRAPAWRAGRYMTDLVKNQNFARADVPAWLRSGLVTRAMTWGTLLLELTLGPALLIPLTATVACALAAVFHAAILLVLDVHLFSWIVIAGLPACLPRPFFESVLGLSVPALGRSALQWSDAVALSAIITYIVVAIAWDPPWPGWLSRQVRRWIGPALERIDWSRGFRFFVDSSASHIDLEITIVTADGEARQWTWDRPERLGPAGPVQQASLPGHRFQRFKFSLVKHREARELLVAKLKADLARGKIRVRGISVDALYRDVHSLAVIGGKNLYAQVARMRGAGLDVDACAKLCAAVHCPSTRLQLQELERLGRRPARHR